MDKAINPEGSCATKNSCDSENTQHYSPGDTNSDPIVDIQNLAVYMPNAKDPVFSGISLAVPRSSIYGIFGETGCGKSTLAQCLAGFVPAHCWHGNIQFFFSDKTKISLNALKENDWRKIRGKRVVYVPQDPYKTLNSYQTVGEQLRRVIAFYKNKTSMETVLSQVCLKPDILSFFPQSLSAGQKQRIIVAHALAVSPELIILDEPTASVDAEAREILASCFINMSQNGHTLIVISHETQEYDPLILPQNRFDFNTRHKIHSIEKLKESAESSAPLLKLTGIQKTFGKFPVLRGVDLTIGLNEWVYLEGVNGCGKTTLLHTILGLTRPDRGTMEWLGQTIPWSRVWRHGKCHIHPAFQDAFHSLNPRIKIGQSLDEVVHSSPREFRKEVETTKCQLWEQMELKAGMEELFPGQISYGQQKRITLLRTLLKYKVESLLDPNSWHLLLLDEVFSGIHWELRDRIARMLQEMRKQNKLSIIWVAHGHQSLKDVCDKVYLMKMGKISRER